MRAAFVREMMGKPQMKGLLKPSVLRSLGSAPYFAALRGGDVLVRGRMLQGMGFARVQARRAAALLAAACWMLQPGVSTCIGVFWPPVSLG